jgi:hypothetical protein
MDELLNALTMIPSPLILLSRAVDWQGKLSALAISIQTPFAVAYHMREALRIYRCESGCRVDNHWRRMDQSVQHLAQAALTYAVTESIPYTAVVAIFHVYALRMLWSRDTSNDGHRWAMLAVGVGLYTLPVAVSGRVALFAYAVVPMVLGCAVAFLPPFKFTGSHAVMHACAWLHADALGIMSNKGQLFIHTKAQTALSTAVFIQTKAQPALAAAAWSSLWGVPRAFSRP